MRDKKRNTVGITSPSKKLCIETIDSEVQRVAVYRHSWSNACHTRVMEELIVFNVDYLKKDKFQGIKI